MTNDEIRITNVSLVLASQSPRRVELMGGAGFAFEILLPEVEEAHDATLSPEALTVENARARLWPEHR